MERHSSKNTLPRSYADAHKYNLRPGGSSSSRTFNKTWGDGGHSFPNGHKPRYVSHPPTFGDFLKTAPVSLSKPSRKIRKVSVITKTAEQQQQDEMVSKVNNSMHKVTRIISDNKFDQKPEKFVAKDVHKSLDEIRRLLGDTDDDWIPVVDGSPENIKRLLDRDVQMLSSCHERMGTPTNRLQSRNFQGMLTDYLEALEKGNNRKRSNTSSSTSASGGGE